MKLNIQFPVYIALIRQNRIVSKSLKHLFYIHSPITYYVSIAVIIYEKLPKEQCVLLFDRDVEIPNTEYRESIFKVPYSFMEVLKVYNKFWKAWPRLKVLDHFIKKVTHKEAFIFYTPSTFTNQLKLVLKNKKCKGYNVIEEGLASYYTLETVNKIYHNISQPRRLNSFLYRLNFKFRLKYETEFLDSSYKTVYCISAKAFPGYKNRIEMPYPFLNEKPYPSYKNILILDSLVESGMISFATFTFAMIDFFEILVKNDISELHYKRHPNQYRTPVDPYNTLFNKLCNKIHFIEIPENESLEFIAGSGKIKELQFFCTYSSAGLYASLSNRKVYSLIELFGKYDDSFLEKTRVYLEKTQYLIPIYTLNKNYSSTVKSDTV